MFANPLIRYILAVPIAVAVVYGLFLGMYDLINDDLELPPEEEKSTISLIKPTEEITEVRMSQRTKPKQMEAASKPPPPPKLSSSKSQIDLPTPTIQGSAPTEVKFERIDSFAIDPVAINDRDAQPIRRPMPDYPNRALERGIEGSCEVRFDVNPQGKPYNVQANCTNDIFRRAAVKAVEQQAEFAPKVVKGQPVGRNGVVYPISFKLG